MILDVILPTFNREALLARTLDSLCAAPVPAGMSVRILVVDNASTDGTRALIRRQSERFGGRLQYLFVPTPGKPHALNAGIAATDGDLIGLIDDDEEIDAGWFACIRREMMNPAIDFIGGKCLPRWESPRPSWLGTGYLGVVGWVDPGDTAKAMDESYPGILMGGNAVVRRRLLERAGPYSTALNRTGARLLGCEDEDMYHRLLAIGARGRYVPELVIHHHVPAARLTKAYFRRWCFWRGVSLGVMDRSRPAPVAYLAGIPRYRVGRALRGVCGLLASLTPWRRSDDAARFEHELACWDLAGFFWGKHVHRVEPAAVVDNRALDREHLA
ncbi:MAG TPA: glycosyltransferase [Vicinamibacterales bacterium]|nr:glycosyltransferase [Vicinamibacterales bacterium]